MAYELVLIWDTGEKEIYEYRTEEEAIQTAVNMKKAFGNQIAWTGTRRKTA